MAGDSSVRKRARLRRQRVSLMSGHAAAFFVRQATHAVLAV